MENNNNKFRTGDFLPPPAPPPRDEWDFPAHLPIHPLPDRSAGRASCPAPDAARTPGCPCWSFPNSAIPRTAWPVRNARTGAPATGTAGAWNRAIRAISAIRSEPETENSRARLTCKRPSCPLPTALDQVAWSPSAVLSLDNSASASSSSPAFLT